MPLEFRIDHILEIQIKSTVVGSVLNPGKGSSDKKFGKCAAEKKTNL